MGSRGSFGSRFGVIAAVSGSVIGLGNIWRFPYVAGENGGAAFILIYIACSFLISIPLMLSEFSLGRSSKRNTKRAFQKLAPGTRWNYVGYMGIFCAFILLSFDCVIAGWALEFIKESVLNEFAGKSAAQISENFNGFIASGWRPVVWMGVFMLSTAFIVWSGIEKGIERYTKIFMPVFIVLLAALAINSLTLPGAREGIGFLLRPDFSKITGATILKAMGQSFFSMSLGLGCMITYGSYIRKGENLPKVASMVALSDMSVAILSGIAIFPAVFSFGISPTSGPELVFLTLPNIFAQMPGGYWIAIVFFVLLFLAAITSSISMFEVIAAYLTEELRMSRPKAVVGVLVTILVTGSLCALSQRPGSSLHIGSMNLFDLCDYLSSNVLMPLGGLLIVIFTGWVFSPEKLRNELTNNLTVNQWCYPAIRLLIRFVVPVVITLLFLTQIGIL